MSHCLVLVLLVVVTSQTISGVILRPNWFPYFRRQPQNGRVTNSQQMREGNPSNSDPIASRQARNSAVEMPMSLDSPCRSKVTSSECLRHMVRILSLMLDFQIEETKNQPYNNLL